MPRRKAELPSEMSADDLRASDLPFRGMSHREFQSQVVRLCQYNGMLYYFTHNSQRSPEGFPDLAIVHPVTGRTIFAELKTAGYSKVTAAQKKWGAALAIKNEYYVWWPWDLASGLIAETLGGSPDEITLGG